MSIVKYQPNTHEQQIISLKSGLPAKDHDPKQLYNLIAIELGKAVVTLRGNMDKFTPQEQQAIAEGVSKEIMLSYRGLTDNEIKYAISRGVSGHYAKENDIIYINLPNVMSWIKGFIEQEKKPITRKISTQENTLPPLVTITPEELKIMQQNAIKSEWDFYCRTGEVQDVGNTVFISLEKMEKINLTKERKLEIFKLAEIAIRSKKKEELNAKPLERRQVTEYLKQLEKGTMNEDIKAEARRIALKEYFDYLKEMEMGITDILE